jgi:hypothetical protein
MIKAITERPTLSIINSSPTTGLAVVADFLDHVRVEGGAEGIVLHLRPGTLALFTRNGRRKIGI